MRTHVRVFAMGWVLGTLLVWAGGGGPAHAAAKVDCDLPALQALAPDATTLTAVSLVAATTTLPEYCRVDGYVTTPGEPGEPDNQVNFRLGLPTAWNHKFYFQGCGGRCGSLVALDAGLMRSYAAATTDTGHQAAVTDSTWAYHARTQEIDYGHRGVHVTTVAAKLLTHAYYGEPLRHAYFSGCSNGGRQALIEAQRYPDDFDGIIGGAPGFGNKGNLNSIWRYQTLLADRDHYLPASKLPLLAEAVLADCDAKDGLVDGLIGDPRRCTFDPASLQCRAGDAPDCLTAGQVETVRKIYAGPTTSAGTQLHPGFPMGHEDGPGGWQLWIVGTNPDHVVELADGTLAFTGTSPLTGDPPLGFAFLDDGLKYLAFEVDDPDYSYRDFDLDTDPPLLDFMDQILGASNPDLSRFNAYGGKLLLYHGWNDPATTGAYRTIQYYEEVVKAVGGTRQTDAFLRLFLAPGMHHCSGGPGPNMFDTLTALESWVEDGVAPTRLIASHSTGGVVDRTRPLCPYPQEARYIGSGSIDQAQNFLCTLPSAP
jgi:feruloyl esterase